MRDDGLMRDALAAGLRAAAEAGRLTDAAAGFLVGGVHSRRACDELLRRKRKRLAATG